MNTTIVAILTIVLHFAPTLGGMAWSIHQHGFYLNPPVAQHQAHVKAKQRS